MQISPIGLNENSAMMDMMEFITRSLFSRSCQFLIQRSSFWTIRSILLTEIDCSLVSGFSFLVTAAYDGVRFSAGEEVGAKAGGTGGVC